MKKSFDELTSSEKAAVLKRRKMFVTFAKVYPPVLLISMLLTVFTIYMTGDFALSFSPHHAAATSGLFATNAVLFGIMFFGIYNYEEAGKFAGRHYLLSVVTLTITYIVSLATTRFLNVYALPLSLCALVLVELSNRRTSMITTLVAACMLIFAYGYGEQFIDVRITGLLISVVCNFVAAIAINSLVNKHLTRLQFIIGALMAALASVPLVIVCTLATGEVGIDLLFNPLWSYGSSAAAVFVFTPLVAIFEGIFNIADDFRLNELTNLNQPLLKRLASEAPGTFNHSLVVGNLAEACANAIGENPNLARAAAYYHDIGKLKSPVYFSENQSTYNPHDELIPEVSVSVITSHTVFGEILAKQYRLPPEIVAVCKEHHGTSPVGYFYRKALNLTEEGDLSVRNFTYPGPKPQSKISAIIMIADTVEAAMRAYTPESKEEYEARVKSLIDEKLKLGQFDECPVTMKDLAVIRSTIIETLPRVQHGRVSYDKKRL